MTDSTPQIQARTRVSVLALFSGLAEGLPLGLGLTPTHAYPLPAPGNEEVSTLIPV